MSTAGSSPSRWLPSDGRSARERRVTHTRASVLQPQAHTEEGIVDTQLAKGLRGSRTAGNSYVGKLTPVSA